jgi:bifunctional UDP-N-acetylglucosamine pyrophosphorylase / glucosamine-1-phosphate N-acetyltransferase
MAAVILAAGMGKRMKSTLPKVMHEAAGLPMVAYPVQAAFDAGASRVVVVVGHGRELVEQFLHDRFGDRVSFAVQTEQLGTAHAVLQAKQALAGFDGPILILYGDVPLVPADLLSDLATTFRQSGAALALATCELEDPIGYGRILRNKSKQIVGIREHRDCSKKELQLCEVNPGLYIVDRAFLFEALASLSSGNSQGEFYLTDVVASAAKRKGGVAGIPADAASLRGVNDRAELARADEAMRARITRNWMLQGVTLRDPGTTFIGPDVQLGVDTFLGAGVHLRGGTKIGTGVQIDAGCVITDTEIGDRAVLLPYTIVSDSRVGQGARLGPFAHIRPASDIGQDAHVGNFVELKKTVLGRGSKANHLAYLGDGMVGKDVNVGAGTIFCNYDGFGKWTTTLDDGCFIGSDSQLVAPIRIGKGAYVGTGSTVTMDVPDGALAIGRAHQVNKEGYAEKIKAKLRARKEEEAQRKAALAALVGAQATATAAAAPSAGSAPPAPARPVAPVAPAAKVAAAAPAGSGSRKRPSPPASSKKKKSPDSRSRR